MGLFDRLATLLKSNINDLISKAENPEKMLDQIVADMRSQLARAKQQVAAAIADEKRLKDQAEAEYKNAADWENKAMLAVKPGRIQTRRTALSVTSSPYPRRRRPPSPRPRECAWSRPRPAACPSSA